MANENGLTGRSITDMEPILFDFVKTRANSFVKWELMRFFDQNPHTADTAENIAGYLGRKVVAVKSELDDLIESGIMERKMLDGLSGYALANDEGTRALVDKFVLACENRDFRVKAVNQILPGRR